MRLTVNGEEHEVPEGTTVPQLLQTLGVAPERVVVELNLTILKRAELSAATLSAGDRVEIVHFVGGGAASSGIRYHLPLSASKKVSDTGPGYQNWLADG